MEEHPSINTTQETGTQLSKSSSSNNANDSPASPSELKKTDFTKQLDSYSLESIVELKISRFLEQIGSYYPENLHTMIMKKAEKPLINQILKRTGNNQVHAAKILGINRNTLRKKMKLYGFS